MNTKLRRTLSWMSALLVVALLTIFFPQPAAADDDDPPGRVARLNYRHGSISFRPAGEPDWVSAVTNRPMTTGDALWADAGARSELQLDSATIRLDGGTGFSFLNLDDRTVQIQLTQGTLYIRVRQLDGDEIFEVDTPNQAFSILRPGQYRVQASEDGDFTIVTVRSGEGEATGGGQTYTLHSGQSGRFSGTDSLYADIFNAGRIDEFDNWSQGRDRRYDESRSARYVSRDLVGYEDLDDNGTWRSDPTYGNVWMPRVASGWAPYREGHWAWISPWGWTWIDDAPWGYAPFHYGRWISQDGSWGWVPGPREIRPVYAPALVVFIGGAQFGGGGGYGGNVGWFPLGPREVYVPGYNASRRYVDRVNVSNTTVTSTTITTVYNSQTTNNLNNRNITYVNRTVSGGVTAVPRSTFTSAQPVARAAVAVNAQQIASAPVTTRAAVAPTRNSVLGTSASTANNVARPPAAIANRSIVAKAPAPPPPVPFEKQQQALAAHPGQPLAHHEVQSLRPEKAAVHPLVKQAPPGKPATPNTNRPGSQPVAEKPGKPANAQPSSAPETKPSAPPSKTGANAPASKTEPVRTDRPAAAQPNQPSSDNRPGRANQGQPASAQSPNAPETKPSNAPASAGGNAPAKKPEAVRDDRPSSTNRGRPAGTPADANPPANKPAATRDNRPPSAPDKGTSSQPAPEVKAQATPQKKAKSKPAKTQDEKGRQEEKKAEDKPQN